MSNVNTEESTISDLDTSVVLHSLNNKSNIISLSFDECDIYNEIAFKLGKSIKSTILLPTLLGSNNILGTNVYRKVTVKSINKIIEEATNYFNEDGKKEIKTDNYNYDLLDNFFNFVNKNNNNWKKALSTRSKKEVMSIVLGLSRYWEMNSQDIIDILNSLKENISLNVDDNIYVMLSSDLFLHVTTDDQMTGTLCNNIALRILLKNLKHEA